MPVTVVVATRNRCSSLGSVLERLRALPERPPIVVVDNGSSDGTQDSVRSRFPDVRLICLDRNAGAAARSVGARHVSTPYVAFSDDDSWWLPGSLPHAVALLDRYPWLALVAAKILVGADLKEDATCAAMAGSPLESAFPRPGRPVLGFFACAAVLRRSAFLEVGGFHERFGVGNEEQLLALDLAQAGWSLAYVPEVVARHDPHTSRDPLGRRRDVARNTLWIGWLRRPLMGALRSTMRVVRQAFRDPSARAGLLAGIRGLGWVLRERRPTSPALEQALRKVEP
jgi:N-acetylglucosaminyl-diphospho-decaprenol L-rhamnosyltransferase